MLINLHHTVMMKRFRCSKCQIQTREIRCQEDVAMQGGNGLNGKSSLQLTSQASQVPTHTIKYQQAIIYNRKLNLYNMCNVAGTNMV